MYISLRQYGVVVRVYFELESQMTWNLKWRIEYIIEKRAQVSCLKVFRLANCLSSFELEKNECIIRDLVVKVKK